MSPVAKTPQVLTHPAYMDTTAATTTTATATATPTVPATPPHANGGGGDGRESSGGSGVSAPSSNGHTSQQGQQQLQQQPQQQQQQQQLNSASKKHPTQKGENQAGEGLMAQPLPQDSGDNLGSGKSLPPLPPPHHADDKSSGLSAKDREDRVRQLRERQQLEKQQKLEELKEQAAAAQRFREQQENERRRRLDEMKVRDAERRFQVEERKRIIQQAEQDRREAVMRKTAEREQRMETKRRNERSSIVFAFGSSTPRMLDPKDNTSASYWGSRRATSTTNVHLVDASIIRRASECGDMDLSRKRATSAHGLDRKPEAEDLMTQSMTAAIPASAARRRTDLMPALPSLRDQTGVRSSPRHRSPGMRSGTVTPNSPSRPTSALSQGSTNSSQVSLRTRTSPRKPRPQSIAGSSLSSADKPRDAPTPPRESRPMDRKLSIGSTSSSNSKPSRAKSAGSDRSAPATPARTPVKAPTSKKTPAQVKAESAAKKAAEKSKGTPKAKNIPKATPAVDSKPLPEAKEKVTQNNEEVKLEDKKVESIEKMIEEIPNAEPNGPESHSEAVMLENKEQSDKKVVANGSVPDMSQTQAEPKVFDVASIVKTESESKEIPDVPVTAEEQSNINLESNIIDKTIESEADLNLKKSNECEKNEEPEKTLAKKAAEKPVTGYATEEEYKAALAEKRRLAREAKEREQELERQRQLEEEERERREEEEYLKMMADQKKAEEERLRKAIEEADRTRVEEAKRKEEEEKQREENERIEQQKKIETEERLKKEEEERQARKSRVAAIMARTRGKGGSNTPTKTEAKTPSEEGKGFSDSMMSTSMTDSMISAMEAAADAQESIAPIHSTSEEPKLPLQSQPTPAKTESETKAFDMSKMAEPLVDKDSEEKSVTMPSTSPEKQEGETSSSIAEVSVGDSASVVREVSSVEVITTSETSVVEDIVSGISSVQAEEPHMNGDTPVPMDTTPTQSVDLLGSLSDVNSVNHNGVDNTPPKTSQGTENLLGSLEPLNSSATSPSASNFEQIIDLGQTKLSNEDAVNSNPPPPFIAFEQNLNKKQTQQTTSSVPDVCIN